jgi:hypothetical protein
MLIPGVRASTELGCAALALTPRNGTQGWQDTRKNETKNIATEKVQTQEMTNIT